LQDALLEVVWRSPGGDTKASRVVVGRNIGRKMPNVNEIGQFKAQTSEKVLLRPPILNLFTSVLISTCPNRPGIHKKPSQGMIFHEPFSVRGAPPSGEI
jgi:hypothetical protein